MILVTGGAGFIGSNFVLDWLSLNDEPVVNLDLLTCAGNLENLVSLEDNPKHIFVRGNFCDVALITSLLQQVQPCTVEAESYFYRSIHGPECFIQTNVIGSFCLLE